MEDSVVVNIEIALPSNNMFIIPPFHAITVTHHHHRHPLPQPYSNQRAAPMDRGDERGRTIFFGCR